MAVLVGVLFGLLPLYQVFRTDLTGIFRQEGRTGTSGRGAVLLRSLLVGSQVAVAFILLIGAGLKAPIRPRIRDEIWVKLWGNLAFNPVSALTMSTLDRITGQDDLRLLCRAMMLEAKTVAEALGTRFAIDIDRRIAGAAEVGEHRTSMLQDLERGRPMEIDALLGAVVELGAMVGQDMPTCRTVLALVRERARQAGCY